MKIPTEVDTAIIGGGIAGLYACLQLRKKKGPDHTMSLFEASDRFGGRIETVEMDGFLAEYGPMRFERRAQPLLMDLICELGLETSYFHPYMAATDPESLYRLKKNEMWRAEGRSSEERLNALELLSLGILRILDSSGGDLDDPRDPRHWEWWAGLDEAYYHQIRTTQTFRGELLWNTGFWNVLSSVLSHKAVEQIIHYGTFYHEIHSNPNAAEWIVFWLRGLHPNDELVGIKEGVEALVTRLVEKLSSVRPPVPLYLNVRLAGIREEGGSHVFLDLREDGGESIVVRARNVVIALPQSPLRRLISFFPDPIGRLIESVIPIPLFKCFFVTKDPWWNAQTPPQTRASSVPTRELHYYYREEGGQRRGMVMVYGDRPSMHYWQPFIVKEPHVRAELNQDKRLPEYYLKYLSLQAQTGTVQEGQTLPSELTCFGIRDWSREPFEAGCHIWKPGIQVENALRELSAFSPSGSGSGRGILHVCGEAYSDFQGFIEGALRTTLAAVEKVE
jgi:hypothetical protein